LSFPTRRSSELKVRPAFLCSQHVSLGSWSARRLVVDMPGVGPGAQEFTSCVEGSASGIPWGRRWADQALVRNSWPARPRCRGGLGGLARAPLGVALAQFGDVSKAVRWKSGLAIFLDGDEPLGCRPAADFLCARRAGRLRGEQ